jgi:hypothetical protein
MDAKDILQYNKMENLGMNSNDDLDSESNSSNHDDDDEERKDVSDESSESAESSESKESKPIVESPESDSYETETEDSIEDSGKPFDPDARAEGNWDSQESPCETVFPDNNSFTTAVFKVKCDSTQPGENVVLVGNLSQLGSWNPSLGRTMTTSNTEYPIWSSKVIIPTNFKLEYKYVISNGDLFRWESNANNRSFLMTSDGTVIIDDFVNF